MLVWMGGSQAGKSSSIKLITRDPRIACGEYGVGRSCTYRLSTYKSKPEAVPARGHPLMHLDTVGLFDNRLVLDEQALTELTENEIVRLARELEQPLVSAFVLVEAANSDAYKLPKLMLLLKKIFQGNVHPSCIVLLTKKN